MSTYMCIYLYIFLHFRRHCQLRCRRPGLLVCIYAYISTYMCIYLYLCAFSASAALSTALPSLKSVCIGISLHFCMASIDICICMSHICAWHRCGVATISGLLKIIGLFCKIQSFLQGSCAKETYNFKEPTNRSHPLCEQGVIFLVTPYTSKDQIFSDIAACAGRQIFSDTIYLYTRDVVTSLCVCRASYIWWHLTSLCTRCDVLDIYIHSDVNMYMYTQWCQSHTYWHHCVYIVMPCIHSDVTMC